MAIFYAIGFKTFFTLGKERAIYRVGDMAVCLEDIVDFGPVVEVEVMTSKAKAWQAKRSIRTFLADIGVTDDQIVAKSVTNMLMREWAHF